MTTTVISSTTNNQVALNFDVSETEKAKEIGIETAKARADRDDAAWTARAYYHLWKYALNGKEFMIEQARIILTDAKLVPVPDNPRAWGGVAKKLAFNGIIERVDHNSTKSKTAHGALATLWKIK